MFTNSTQSNYYFYYTKKDNTLMYSYHTGFREPRIGIGITISKEWRIDLDLLFWTVSLYFDKGHVQ